MNDYISRDEAINAIKSLESSMPAKDNYAKGYDVALGRVLIAVRTVPPAADVKPVKHGRWVRESNYRDYDGDICSVYSCPVCSVRSGDTTNYCPNCGAKMDGDDTYDKPT